MKKSFFAWEDINHSLELRLGDQTSTTKNSSALFKELKKEAQIRVLPDSQLALAEAPKDLQKKLNCTILYQLKRGQLELLFQKENQHYCLEVGRHELVLKNSEGFGWLRFELKQHEESDEILVFPEAGLNVRAQLNTKLVEPSFKSGSSWKIKLIKNNENSIIQAKQSIEHARVFEQADSLKEFNTTQNVPQILGPYSGALFISSSAETQTIPLRWKTLPAGFRAEIEVIRWDDPYFTFVPILAASGAILNLSNGNYRWRVRMVHSSGAKLDRGSDWISDWSGEKMFSIQEYNFGMHFALPFQGASK